MYSTTTFDRIVGLYARAGELLAQDGMTAAELAELAGIQGQLDILWRTRRAELVRAASGEPQILGGGSESDQRRGLAAIGGAA